MNKKQALEQVTDWTAAYLQGCTLDEASGLNTDDMSEADQNRLGWAVETVIERLHRMGGVTK